MTEPSASKKTRRKQRACDACRRKKARCNGSGIPGSRCAICTTFDIECTYNEPSLRRPRPRNPSNTVDARLRTLESSLRDLKTPPYRDVLPHFFVSRLDSSHTVAESEKPVPGTEDDWEDYEEPEESLTEWLEQLELDPTRRRPFVGPASNKQLIKDTIGLKKELYGEDAHPLMRRHEFWVVDPRPASLFSQSQVLGATQQFNFPPVDLQPILIENYFRRHNDYFPLLHRGTFESLLTQGLHFRSRSFACVLLIVCAIGSRYSDDLRVLGSGGSQSAGAVGSSNTTHKHFAGWHWFEQVRIGSWPVLAVPRLYDVQVYALAGIYMSGISFAGLWLLVSHGIKLAMDAGVHRRQIYSKQLSADEELWKRAFWVLVSFDRLIVPGTGRPFTIQEEDFDVDWLVECDDEHWDTSAKPHSFNQPPGTPSKIAAFNHFLKLQQIFTYAVRKLYSAKALQLPYGNPQRPAENDTIVEIDSALNRWLEATPKHLRWDPAREKSIFYYHSAHLRSMYYHIQITIHRPHIMRKGPSVASFPSLAVCTNAARANSYVLGELAHESNGVPTPFPWTIPTAFSAAVVLLLSLWQPQGTRLGTAEIENVEKCLSYLTSAEDIMLPAGQFADVVRELASLGNLPATANARSHPTNGKLQSSLESLQANWWLPSESSNSTNQTNTAPPANAVDSSYSSQEPLGIPHVQAQGFSTQGSSYLAENSTTTPFSVFEQNAMDFWASAPIGFRVQDWGTYLQDIKDSEWLTTNHGNHGIPGL